MNKYKESNRPSDWFSQKNCALQYNQLIEKVEKETPRRKRGGVDIVTETPGEAIVKKLMGERMKELKKEVERYVIVIY